MKNTLVLIIAFSVSAFANDEKNENIPKLAKQKYEMLQITEKLSPPRKKPNGCLNCKRKMVHRELKKTNRDQFKLTRSNFNSNLQNLISQNLSCDDRFKVVRMLEWSEKFNVLYPPEFLQGLAGSIRSVLDTNIIDEESIEEYIAKTELDCY